MMQEFVHQVNESVKSTVKAMHTAMPGRIIALDPETMLATVKPVMLFRKPDGSTVEYPHLTGVPVVFPQGNGQAASIAYPVKAGDGCLIVVAERPLDYWMYGQETVTELAFDLTNAICIPGMFNSPNDAMREACVSNAVVIKAKRTKVVVKNDGVEIDAPTVTVNGNLDVKGKISGEALDVGGISFKSHKHRGDSGGTTSAPI